MILTMLLAIAAVLPKNDFKDYFNPSKPYDDAPGSKPYKLAQGPDDKDADPVWGMLFPAEDGDPHATFTPSASHRGKIIPPGAWYDAIKKLEKDGFVSGYPDGKFRGSESADRHWGIYVYGNDALKPPVAGTTPKVQEEPLSDDVGMSANRPPSGPVQDFGPPSVDPTDEAPGNLFWDVLFWALVGAFVVSVLFAFRKLNRG